MTGVASYIQLVALQNNIAIYSKIGDTHALMNKGQCSQQIAHNNWQLIFIKQAVHLHTNELIYNTALGSMQTTEMIGQIHKKPCCYLIWSDILYI